MKSLPHEASNHTRSATNSSQEISTLMQFTDKLFEPCLQILIPMLVQIPNGTINQVIDSERLFVFEYVNVPTSVV